MASRWTVRLFTLFDIPVRIHLMAPALAVVLTVATPDYTRREVVLALA